MVALKNTKKGVFFSLDILFAIILVFIFSIFIQAHISSSGITGDLSHHKGFKTAVDISDILYETNALHYIISGSLDDLPFNLSEIIPEQYCYNITISESSSYTTSFQKEGCFISSTKYVQSFFQHYDNSMYVLEVSLWFS